MLFKLEALYFAAILAIVVNLYISRRFLSFVEPYSGALNCVKTIMSVSQSLYMNKAFDSIDQLKPLKEKIENIRNSKYLLRFLMFSQLSPNFLIGYPMSLVNLIIPIDILLYAYLIDAVEKNVDTMRLSFDSVGEMDSSIALASYLERYPDHCNPEFFSGQRLDFKNVRHPLVVDCVDNSFCSTGESALITGSNMAGKTTFIRVIGINVILSRTLWLSHAEKAIVPLCNVASSISNSDYLEEGKSYYFAELEHINRFLYLAESDEQYLFLIDEIFRGTNTVERIGSSAAVLEELAKGSMVFVTTHDRELEEFVKQSYLMWHFQETGDKEIPFDYKIRSGVCKSRNAIKLMASLGFPNEIVEKAKLVANQIGEKRPEKQGSLKVNESHFE